MKRKPNFYKDDLPLFRRLHEAYKRMKEQEISGKLREAPKMLEIDLLNEQLYLLTKLRLKIRRLIHLEILKPASIDLPESTFSLLDQQLELHEDLVGRTPILLAYREVIRFYQRDYFEPGAMTTALQFLETLKEFESEIGTSDFMDLVSIIDNWCAKAGNLGVKGMRIPAFCCLVLVINSGVKQMKRSYELPYRTFKNVVFIAISEKNRIPWSNIELKGLSPYKEPFRAEDWVRQFIKVYSKYLAIGKKESYVKYCQAYISMKQGDFQESFRLLREVKPLRGGILVLDIKRLLLMVMYELEERGLPIPRDKDGLIPSTSIDQIKDNYRKQLRYLEQSNKGLSFQLKIHRSFLQEFGELYGFFRKNKASFRSKESSVHFSKRKYELQKRLGKKRFAFSPWILDKLAQIN